MLQADLAALRHGLDALLQWQAEAAAQAAAGGYAVEVPAVQTAFLLDLGIKANLQHVTQVLPHTCSHIVTPGCKHPQMSKEHAPQSMHMTALCVSYCCPRHGRDVQNTSRSANTALQRPMAAAGVMRSPSPRRAWRRTCRRGMQRPSQQTWRRCAHSA